MLNPRESLALEQNKGSTRHYGWEGKLGWIAGVTLSVLEVKRLLLLTFEILLDYRAIHFADALLPIIFSFVDVGIGLPIALFSLHSFRRYKEKPCHPGTPIFLRQASVALAICMALNLVTIILMIVYVNTKSDSLRQAFDVSMRSYATKASHKVALDELQLDFECCGCEAYTDWFAFAWQVIDYEDAEDKSEYSEESVPFSCCDRRSLLACLHTAMRDGDEKTINCRGCAPVIGDILYRIALVGYVITTLILCTQLLIIIYLIRIIKIALPKMCLSDCYCDFPYDDNSNE